MIKIHSSKQHGAVLVVSLIMLLALTLLAISSMHGVAIETRITGAQLEKQRLDNLVNAALREGEFRLYGGGNISDKLEPRLSVNCIKNNKIKSNVASKPCLLSTMSAEQLLRYYLSPVSFLNEVGEYAKNYDYTNIDDIEKAGFDAIVAWMPYRGIDPKQAEYYETSGDIKVYWNSYRMDLGPPYFVTENPEYGSGLEGRGTFNYLVTAQAKSNVAAQSTVSVIYLGINE